MNILGVNCALHDISVALLKDGEIVAAIEEERITGKKHEGGILIGGGMPEKSLKWILESQCIKLSEIDYFCYSGNVEQQHLSINAQINRLVAMAKGADPNLKRTVFFDHHLCHAASAFAGSGFKEALIVTVDGEGDSVSCALHFGKDREGIETFYKLPPSSSLGHLYSRVTSALNFRNYGDEGKVMALSDYGEVLDEFDGVLKMSDIYLDVDANMLNKLIDKAKKSVTFEEKANVAATVQSILEKGMAWVVKLGLKHVKTKNVCIGGGVAYNCKANYAVSRIEEVESVYIPFMPGDAGTSIGAAILGAYMFDRVPFSNYNMSPYLGPEYSDEYIENVLKNFRIKYTKLNDPCATGAQILAEGNPIIWFQGRMEFGPRALGNRSIIAPPNITGISDFINNAVKHREKWRPFAPSVLEEDVLELFERKCRFPYMSITQQVRKEAYPKMSEVKSVNGSARLQTVHWKDNPVYWSLIKNYKKISGIPAVLNTSLNDRQQPLIMNPELAIKLLYTSGLEHMIIGAFHIIK